MLTALDRLAEESGECESGFHRLQSPEMSKTIIQFVQKLNTFSQMIDAFATIHVRYFIWFTFVLCITASRKTLQEIYRPTEEFCNGQMIVTRGNCHQVSCFFSNLGFLFGHQHNNLIV